MFAELWAGHLGGVRLQGAVHGGGVIGDGGPDPVTVPAANKAWGRERDARYVGAPAATPPPHAIAMITLVRAENMPSSFRDRVPRKATRSPKEASAVKVALRRNHGVTAGGNALSAGARYDDGRRASII